MLENCKFCELEESVLRENNGFTCADNNLTVFFSQRNMQTMHINF